MLAEGADGDSGRQGEPQHREAPDGEPVHAPEGVERGAVGAGSTMCLGAAEVGRQGGGGVDDDAGAITEAYQLGPKCPNAG